MDTVPVCDKITLVVRSQKALPDKIYTMLTGVTYIESDFEIPFDVQILEATDYHKVNINDYAQLFIFYFEANNEKDLELFRNYCTTNRDTERAARTLSLLVYDQMMADKVKSEDYENTMLIKKKYFAKVGFFNRTIWNDFTDETSNGIKEFILNFLKPSILKSIIRKRKRSFLVIDSGLEFCRDPFMKILEENHCRPEHKTFASNNLEVEGIGFALLLINRTGNIIYDVAEQSEKLAKFYGKHKLLIGLSILGKKLVVFYITEEAKNMDDSLGLRDSNDNRVTAASLTYQRKTSFTGLFSHDSKKMSDPELGRATTILQEFFLTN
jgi:hypothetical protein